MSYSFLLIGSREESPSFVSLSNALNSLGKLQILPETEAMQAAIDFKYHMILIDATIVHDEIAIISKILEYHSHARILVLTASPTWRRARETLQAGAMGYISKTLSEKEYFDKFKQILAIDPHLEFKSTS